MSGHQLFLHSLNLRMQGRIERQLVRERRHMQSPQGVKVVIDGKQLLSFCSNDYLGLANHPDVIAAFKRGLDEYGAGSGASHLVTGHTRAHTALEEELADFTGRSRALLFGSGYMANVGVLTTLIDDKDQVFEDKLNHASLLDGGLFSGANFRRYPHKDMKRLEQMLDGAEPEGLRLLVSDGVFSMDGDVAPLGQLLKIADKYRGIMMIDDAHGFGCLGKNGGGVVEAAQERGAQIDEIRLPILMGTLGKAFGTAGAFVAGCDELIESLIQFSRPYIYTTALPAALAVATRASLQLVRNEGWRREHLRTLVQRFRKGAAELKLNLLDSPTQIQVLILETAERALAASVQLEQQGILATAIRPPTVPPGTSRLRLTLSAAHTEQHVDQLLAALAGLKLPPVRA
ncbi:MAG TPA: 8-amino-7-oxononanoate synthase [Candidatus Acidoferrum sp.]|nr:8-amino-7-oxononanoate synthase [Candidatus Acidoferrum sp.]